ncbi:tripartite tricarboxylate transporter permease [Caproiciproducens faecalis]|uniref:Tripartite tricarboxylate transporter permease n=1 Tax=Caproiciproducens faecalis TaxID=2820301 RepID=A0ABS7DQ77_9FIRM|nr:tripartite tricarboxylate transporter permease [Caproiciproducens faecalis]MBW7573212.1 tripartite tricarboxylate transporter permease [Caproiciproducens faecalis]
MIWGNLFNAFIQTFSQQNLLACFIGVLTGTVVGVLPGIGPVGAMALLLPFSYGMDPGSGLIMFAGIYYGSMYGGSTTSILLNMPGESVSVITCLDGYKMAKKGRAGAALSISAIGSFVAGTLGIVGLMLFAPPLARFALSFAAPEYFAIAVIGIILLSNLTGNSFLKSFLMVIIGMMLSSIGTDPLTGFIRLTFHVPELTRGIDILPISMGAFGLAEVLTTVVEPYSTGDLIKIKAKDLYPTKNEMKRSTMPILRGSLLGFFIGLIPGPSAVISSLVSYKMEKTVSKHPEEFGEGAIEGVAGPESANNSASSGAMIPLLALGLPFNANTAMLLTGLMIHGITPGPTFITEHSDLFWLAVASMYVGNIMLLILNLPLVGIFAKLTNVPAKILMPIVTALMLLGAYSVNSSMFDVILILIFGIAGFALKYFKVSAAPLVIGLVLGSISEEGLRQGLIMSDGSFMGFLTRPISGSIFAVTFIMLIFIIFKNFRSKKIVFDEAV